MGLRVPLCKDSFVLSKVSLKQFVETHKPVASEVDTELMKRNRKNNSAQQLLLLLPKRLAKNVLSQKEETLKAAQQAHKETSVISNEKQHKEEPIRAAATEAQHCKQ